MIDKMIELLLSRKQNAKYESDCQNANSFLSKYHDFNSMCKFIVTNVHKKRKRLRSRNQCMLTSKSFITCFRSVKSITKRFINTNKMKNVANKFLKRSCLRSCFKIFTISTRCLIEMNDS